MPDTDLAGFEILKRPAHAEDFSEAWLRISSGNQLVALLRDALQWQALDTVRALLGDWKFFLARRPADATMVDVLLVCAEIAAGHSAFERLAAIAAATVPSAPSPAGPPRGSASASDHWARVVRPWIMKVEWKSPFSAAWVMDVLHLLTERNPASERWNAGRRIATTSATLALLTRVRDKAVPRGVVATLRVEALEEGSGIVYADPATHAFLRADRDFSRSIAAAVACVRNHGLWITPSHDLRWSLTREDGPDIGDLAGPSAGLAFGLCFAQVLASIEPPASGASAGAKRLSDLAVERLDLRGVAATAILDEDGNITPVGYAIEKVVAAAKDAVFPKSHTVIVAADQVLDLSVAMTKDMDTGTWRLPGATFVVDNARSFVEAIEKVKAERWRHVDATPLQAAGPRVSRRSQAAVAFVVALATVVLFGAGGLGRRLPSDAGATKGFRGDAAATSGGPTSAMTAQVSTRARAADERVASSTQTPPVARPKLLTSPQSTQGVGQVDSPSAVFAVGPAPPASERRVVVARGPLAEQLKNLTVRRDVIIPVIDDLRERQRKSGAGLGSHLAGPLARMTRFLSGAEAEIAQPNMDEEEAANSLRAAQQEIETLEKLLNIRN